MDNEKKIYAVYVDILKIHKEFYERIPSAEEKEEFIQRINLINANHNSYFCYLMCDALRKWFVKKFSGVKFEELGKYYSELWHFHKEHLNISNTHNWEKIVTAADTFVRQYELEACDDMVLAIVADLDRRTKQEMDA